MKQLQAGTGRVPRRHRLGFVAAWAASALLLVGCGAPSAGTTTKIDPTQVPYGLLSIAPTGAEAVPDSDPSGPTIWFVRRDRLVPSSAVPGDGTALDQANLLLRSLAAGPNSQQRDEGLSTSLGPGIRLNVRYVVDGVANVEYIAGENSRAGAETPLMIGQIVLTLTSVPGVREVIFDNGTRQVEAPLPGGALTDSPVSADDYLELVAA